MPKLSICIPVEPGRQPPLYVARHLLADPEADIEILVAPYGDTCMSANELYALADADPRLHILPPAPESISAANLWIGTVASMRGDWVTLIRPEDMLETDMDFLLKALENLMPDVDALGWNSIQIDASAPRNLPAAVPIAMQHHVRPIEKSEMLDAFFNWTESSNTPRMPFGLYHGAIKRSLVEAVLGSSGEMSWMTPLPQYEWAARVLLFSKELALCARPLSAIDARPYVPVPVPSPLLDVPFNAAIGLTAAIAEIQCRILRECGSEWAGFSDKFIRACMLDCILEHDEARFEAKCQGYYAALQEFEGGRLASEFRPPYLPAPQPETRRGSQGGLTVMVDRFIGNATNAQEFYAVIHYMLTNVRVVADIDIKSAA